MNRTIYALVALGLGVVAAMACGGASKPPLTPDVDQVDADGGVSGQGNVSPPTANAPPSK